MQQTLKVYIDIDSQYAAAPRNSAQKENEEEKTVARAIVGTHLNEDTILISEYQE